MLIDYSYYRIIVMAHVFAVFIFLLAHGASAMAAFQLRTERRRERVAALLELSAFSNTAMSIGLIIVLITAVTMGYLGEHLDKAWFYTALIVFFAMSFIMTPFATNPFSTVRRSMGLKGPRMAGKRGNDPTDPLTDEEMDAQLNRVNPWALATVGLGGIAVLQWLMMFQPF